MLPRRVELEAALTQLGPVGRHGVVGRAVPNLMDDARDGARARPGDGLLVGESQLGLRHGDAGMAAKDAGGRRSGAGGEAEDEQGQAGADEADEEAAEAGARGRHGGS